MRQDRREPSELRCAACDNRNFCSSGRILRQMRRLREKLTYANVMATAAAFIALGGTSYAVTALPRNSVGSKQIRAKAVGPSELKTGSVRSAEIKRRSIRLDDLSLGARRSLRGQTGPAGPQGPAGPSGVAFTAAVDSQANVRSATAGRSAGWMSGSGRYEVVFERDMRSCFAVATLGRFAENQPTPDSGQVTTETTSRGVVVRTRNASGAPADLPFHLIVVC